MLEIVPLLRRIDADFRLETNRLAAVGRGGDVDRSRRCIRVTFDVENFLAGKPQRIGAFAIHELQRQYAHADQVGAVNALVAFGNNRFNTEQHRSLRRPVP